jgi:putative nucleotidyltransferase with HDIG domain
MPRRSPTITTIVRRGSPTPCTNLLPCVTATPDYILPPFPPMRLSPTTLATAGATVAAAWLIRHEQAGRRSAERFAAAALETLLKAIDANDALTGAHVRRVATYATILADEAGLPDRDQRTVERVALFHDIGKIHEALFDIIHDDDKLTPSERRAIATHPERGAHVLAPLNGFYPELADGVLSHHERWDGTGYPRRLKGRRIPIAARIVAIADTYDAITHRRRYRGGRSADTARDAILDGRGTQFDPELVDLFTLPPVFARIRAAEQEVAGWREPVEPRQAGRDEEQVPDITFRWRPGQPSKPARRSPARPHRTTR